MGLKIFQSAALIVIVTFSVILTSCDEIPPDTVTPTATRVQENLPTRVNTDLSKWDGARVISIPRGTQGQIGDVRIGLTNTKASEYINKSGEMQRGMVADLIISIKDGATEPKPVYLGQSFESGGYAFLVEEIKPTNLKPDSPDGATGGGSISLLCIPAKEINKPAVSSTPSASISPIIPTGKLTSTPAPSFSPTITPVITPTPVSGTNSPPPLLAPVFTVPLARTNCYVQLPVLGGVPPYSWSIWSGQLPAGYSLDSFGRITGSFTGTGDVYIGAQMVVRDSAGTTVMVKHDGNVNSNIIFTYGFVRSGYYNPGEQPGCKENPAVCYTDCTFHFSPFVAGGTKPLTFFANGLPLGLSCDSSTGIIEGKPAKSAAGQVYQVAVYGKDAAGNVGAGSAGLYISVVDRSPATTTTGSKTGSIPEIVGAWHGTLAGSGTFTMYITSQSGSSAPGNISLKYPGLVISSIPFTADIKSDGTLGFTATKGSFTFRFDGKVQGNAVSGNYSGGATGYTYGGTWQGTRP